MKINSDFADLLRELNGASARYLIVGGLAPAFHDQPRFTKDLYKTLNRNLRGQARWTRAVDSRTLAR